MRLLLAVEGHSLIMSLNVNYYLQNAKKTAGICLCSLKKSINQNVCFILENENKKCIIIR